ncbi:PspC domain-containing protein [Eisenibacter elegans]|jgi:phage shock protein PspC (stress-responsive transcriptional regulator)/Flp pilus assembly protein TadD|uniref:PspC domain-containing protein n=1 Tax=Eisenibacter elegans TaxID=997 RepID=UPI0004154B4B|nr:PspC domain-containing protein [Eisenibacter elegans]
MEYSDDHIIQAYIEQVLKIQNQQTNISELELARIAADLGLSDQDRANIRARFDEYMLRGAGYSRYEDWDSAIEELGQAVTLSPANGEAVYLLANAYKQRWALRKSKDDFSKAKTYAKRAVHINPANENAIRLSAELNRGTATYTRNRKDRKFKATLGNDKDTVEFNLPIRPPSGHLRKSRVDRKIMGVCGGIAEYFGIDAAIIRVIFAAGAFMSSGTLIIVYLLLAYILPEK